MKIGEVINDNGILASRHKCDTCGTEYEICPVIADDEEGWENCLLDECESYDPHRDADILFMTDKEIAEDKPLISMDKLRQRKSKRL